MPDVFEGLCLNHNTATSTYISLAKASQWAKCNTNEEEKYRPLSILETTKKSHIKNRVV